jgi:hypothetical protein
MATPRFYAAQVKNNALEFFSDFARFLVNDLVSFTGPGWKIIEAYDDAAASRQVPSTDTDMDSFTGTFSWKDNTVAANDWIVLESVIGGGANEFQVFFRVSTSTAIQVQLVPLGNWTTDVGTPTTSPTKPATVQPASVVTVTGSTLRGAYSIVSDEGMFAFLFDLAQRQITSNPANWIYVGELDGHRPADPHPYVIWDTPAEVRWIDFFVAAGNWNRLSPLDGDVASDSGTSLTAGVESYMWVNAIGQALHRDFPAIKPLGEERPLPIGVFFPDAGHRHFAGFLRNVYSAHPHLGAMGTMGGKKYLWRNDATVANSAGICFLWDQATAYPPDSTP